jgi:hypothetical protein
MRQTTVAKAAFNGAPSSSLSLQVRQHCPQRGAPAIGERECSASVTISEALHRNVRDDSIMRSRLLDLGYAIFPRQQQMPEALGALVKRDAEKWWPIIKASWYQAGMIRAIWSQISITAVRQAGLLRCIIFSDRMSELGQSETPNHVRCDGSFFRKRPRDPGRSACHEQKGARRRPSSSISHAVATMLLRINRAHAA